jgi:hypothetical protein
MTSFGHSAMETREQAPDQGWKQLAMPLGTQPVSLQAGNWRESKVG